MKSHISDDIQKRVVEFIRKREKVKDLRIGSVETDEIPSTGKNLYKIDAFKFDDPNGPRFSCVVDEDGKEVDVKALGRSESKVFLKKNRWHLDHLVRWRRPLPQSRSIRPTTI
jgi:hypothetical protein